MGSGQKMYRMALGAAQGEAAAIQEHEKAMIPIMQEQAEVQLDISSRAFEQQIEQAKRLSTLVDELDKKAGATTQPIYVTQEAPAQKTNYMLYAGIAIVAFIFLKGKK